MIFGDGAARAARHQAIIGGARASGAGGDLGEWWDEQQRRKDGFRRGEFDRKPVAALNSRERR
jgi:hypothetical protein